MATARKIRLPQEALNLLREVVFHLKGNREGEVFLVGGTVRDLLLGKPAPTDLDLAVSFDPTDLVRDYAREKKAGFVVLDDERQIARVIRSGEETTYSIDIARFREPTAEGDLRGRDFTINAIGAKLTWPLLEEELEIFDPLGGLDHLAEKKLVPCSPTLFKDDPLRMMRAFRFGAVLDFSFSEELRDLIRSDARLLEKSSPERVRDELFKILAVANSHKWIRGLSEAGLLGLLLPEMEASRGVTQNRWHHLDVFDHTVEMLAFFESYLQQGELPIEGWKKFRQFLGEHISGSRTFGEVFKFACLLHDLGKPACRKTNPETGEVIFHGHEMEGVRLCRDICERMKLSVAEINLISKVVKNHMRPGVILQEGLSDRKLFKYFSETGRDGVGIALMSLADRKAAQGGVSPAELEDFEKGIFSIMSDFYRQMEYARQAPLLTGTDLMTEFRLQPGPQFGEILEAVKEAQHLGKIRDKTEAKAFVARLLSKNPNP